MRCARRRLDQIIPQFLAVVGPDQNRAKHCESRHCATIVTRHSFGIPFALTLPSRCLTLDGRFMGMLSPLFHLVALVVCEDQVQPGLARVALRNRWPILDLRSVKPILKQVLRARPQVVVVQVPPPDQSQLAKMEHLVSKLARHWNPISIIAIGTEHASESETLMRRAGVDCFVGGECSEESLESVLETMHPGIIGQSRILAESAFPAAPRNEPHTHAASKRTRAGH